MSYIDEIKITIPSQTIELVYLQKIFLMCQNVAAVNENTLECTNDKELKPTISLVTTNGIDPTISFITKPKLEKDSFWVGRMPMGFNLKDVSINNKITTKPVVETKSDQIGEYLEVKWPQGTYSQLSFQQLYNRLKNKLTKIDHIGININPNLLPKDKYTKMKKMVAEQTYLCDYFQGKEWPFVIPTTLIERNHPIKAGVNRDPKFEFVYDFAYPYPEIQIDLQTSMPPKDVLHLFPPPYGYYDPTPLTGGYCSSVFIYTGWPHVSLRMDLRFYVPSSNLTDILLTKCKRVG